MRAVHCLFTTTCLLVALTPCESRAQQDQIPKELALALLPFGANEGGEIIVGKLPPDLAAAITLPPGGRVLGSFMSLGYGQSVFTLPFPADSARAFVRRSLVDHGWVAREQMAPRMGGLQFGPRGAQPAIFCRPGTPDGVNLTTRFYGRETLVHLTRSSGLASCESEVGGTGRMVAMSSSGALSPGGRYMPLSSIPPLWSPGDPMTSMRQCRPSTTNGELPFQSQEQLLRTELSAPEILTFYGRQLDSAGWKAAAVPNESVARTWTRAASSGDSAQDVTLTVTRLTIPGCYQIELRATAPGARR